MARPSLLLLLLAASLMLAGCAGLPLTPDDARATAVVGGCWPYGARQPLPPTARPATATPRLRGPDDPPPATVTATATPWRIYPACTPAPGTPTVTPPPTAVPTAWVPPTPQPPASISAADELQDATGIVRERGLAWAYNPRAKGPVIVWTAYGQAAGTIDGQVWVTSRNAEGIWRAPQTVNTAPVVRDYGQAAVAAAPDGTLRILYATGNPETASVIYEVTSADDGATWSLPRDVGRGSVQSLRADSDGGWHAIIIGDAPFDAPLRYGERSASGTWQWRSLSGATDEYRAELEILELGGQRIRLILTTNQRQSHVLVYRSTDGSAWSLADVAGAYPFYRSMPTIHPVLLAVPRGNGLVVAAWSNYGTGMVAASLSYDGGQTFGPPEVIAQHHPNLEIVEEVDYGVEPGLAYDPEADMLLASWNEVETGAGEVFPWPVRSFLALRPVEQAPGQPWRDAVTPDTIDLPRRVLDPQRRTFLYATPDGAHAGLLIIDERNFQWRVSYRTVHLPELTTYPES